MNNWQVKEKEKWYNNEEECNNQDVETNIVLGLSENFDVAAQVIYEKLGYESFNEYVSNLVRINVRMELDGAGSLEKNDIEEVDKKMMQKLNEINK